MISCALLERPGKWRAIGIAGGLAFALAPALVLILTFGSASPGQITALLGSSYGGLLLRSLAVGMAVSLLSVAVGLPVGTLAGLYDFPSRSTLLCLMALPLLVPSFLCAIGLSMLRMALALPRESLLSGFTGTVLAFSMFGVPLVVFITLASVRGISRSQVDAARLAGGEVYLVGRVARNVFPAALLTSVLAGVLTLSDPGPGQILGFAGAASEILASFASQYDFALAARQCVALSVMVFLLGLPVALRLAPQLATGLLARDTTPVPLICTKPMRLLGPPLLLVVFLFTTVLPLAGFAQPLFHEFPVQRAWQEVNRTLPNTVFYAAFASVLATGLGIALALCAGRAGTLRIFLLAGLMLVFALPPALGALGFIHLASHSAAEFDLLLRSRFTVSLSLALRFFPIAAVFALRSFGTTSPSWTAAATLHGVTLPAFFRKVLSPWLAGAMVPASLLIALLAIADVGSVLLLHPPGMGSLPLAIFTIMANAPESLVGSLCLFYVAGAATFLGLTILVARYLKGQP